MRFSSSRHKLLHITTPVTGFHNAPPSPAIGGGEGWCQGQNPTDASLFRAKINSDYNDFVAWVALEVVDSSWWKRQLRVKSAGSTVQFCDYEVRNGIAYGAAQVTAEFGARLTVATSLP
jgi:hypothetical protein